MGRAILRQVVLSCVKKEAVPTRDCKPCVLQWCLFGFPISKFLSFIPDPNSLNGELWRHCISQINPFTSKLLLVTVYMTAIESKLGQLLHSKSSKQAAEMPVTPQISREANRWERAYLHQYQRLQIRAATHHLTVFNFLYMICPWIPFLVHSSQMQRSK